VPAGTASAAQIVDTSVGVRVTETKAPSCTQSGSDAPGGQRQMA